MNFRNNSFQNNNIPGGYQNPMGSSYNSQFYGRGRASVRNSNIPMPNYMYPTYNNQGSYSYGGNARYPNSCGYMNYNNYNNTYMPYTPRSSGSQYNQDMYNNSRALDTNNRRLRYSTLADPVARERRRWSYERDNLLSDSYNYDDYYDDVCLRDKNLRRNYKSRFFTKLARNKKLKLDDLEDERDTEVYSSREDRLKSRRKSRDVCDSDYEDEEDYEYDDLEDERDSRKRKVKKRSRSRYEEDDDYEDEDEEDYEYDDLEDERDSRKRKVKKRSRSRYEDEEDDDCEVYDSMSRRPRFVSGPIDFFKKKRRG